MVATPSKKPRISIDPIITGNANHAFHFFFNNYIIPVFNPVALLAGHVLLLTGPVSTYIVSILGKNFNKLLRQILTPF